MNITNVNNASPTSQTSSAAQQASDTFNTDFNSFLKLLTTQLQNQDPLAPMDSSQFVTQLTQLSSVEQAIKTNTNLETVIDKLSHSSSKGDIALLGKSIEFYSNKIHLSEENPEFMYQLAENAYEVKVTIKDAGNNPVRTFENMPKTMGERHSITWDGKDDNGNQLEYGNYSIYISAKNSAGGNISSDTIAKSKVLQVGLENGMSYLKLDNGEAIDPVEVQSVS